MRFLKNNSKSLLNFLTVVLLFASVPLLAHADGGNSGGGGDALAMEFTGYAHAWDRLLSAIPEDERLGIDPKKFHEAVESAVVRTKDHVDFGGEVDAYNEPGKILLSRSRLRDQIKAQKFGLALHEYLGTMGLDRKYELSEPLLKKYVMVGLPPDAGVCQFLHADQVVGKLLLDFAAAQYDTGINPSLLDSSSIAVMGLRKDADESLFLVQVDASPVQHVAATVRCIESQGGIHKIMGFSWHSAKSTGVAGGNDFDANATTLKDPRVNGSTACKEVVDSGTATTESAFSSHSSSAK